jgi:hypothetical protein
MATISAPSASLFDPDGLEQIYARGTQMPGGMGGLQYLLGYGAKLGRENRSREYLGALGQTQQLEAIMGSKKIAGDLQKARMDNSRHLANAGYLPSQLTGGSDLFTDPSSGDAFAQLLQEEIRSKIFANMNRGAGGGGGSKDQVTVKTAVMPWGVPGATEITSRSSNPETAMANNRGRVQSILNDMKVNPQNYTAAQKQQVIQLMQQQGNARNPGIQD